MSDPLEDLDGLDHWSRLLKWLRQEKADLQNEIIVGELEPEQYKAKCAEASRIDKILRQADQIYRDRDLRRAPSWPAQNPEE